jgi:hypothetical protein
VPERTPPGKGPLIIAGVLLAIAIIVPLLVWTYAKPEPDLNGVPFFFWYQFMLVIGSVVLTSIAYWLVIGHERDRRAFEGRRD